MPKQARSDQSEPEAAAEKPTTFAERVGGSRAATSELEHLRVGNAVASIFTNQSENGAYDTVQFQKVYKKDGKNEYTSSFGAGDLLELSKCADKAHDRLMERRLERYEAQNQGHSR